MSMRRSPFVIPFGVRYFASVICGSSILEADLNRDLNFDDEEDGRSFGKSALVASVR
jgi:hypothetical protein